MENILKLEELTSKLAVSPHLDEYDVGLPDPCKVYNLFHKGGAGVVNAYIPEGGTFPRHEHSIREWLIVWEGEVEIARNGSTETYRDGEYALIEPHEPHQVTALKETWLIGVTVPADTGYPG